MNNSTRASKADVLFERLRGVDMLRDGIYEVPDGAVVEWFDFESIDSMKPHNEAELDKMGKFLDTHPKCVVGQAYEVYGVFLISEMPKLLGRHKIWGSFGMGCCGFIDGAPNRLLVLAEND